MIWKHAQRIRGLAAVVLLATLAGCATTGERPHGNAKAGAPTSGFETKTLYSCTAGTGSQLLFSTGKWFVQVMSNGGTVWVKPHSSLETPGTPPTNPTPSANSIADGWIRLLNSESATWGKDPGTTATESAPPSGMAMEQIAFLDEWCEAQGDLAAIAH